MKKRKTYKVDFGGVEGAPGQRRGGRRIPEGDYLAKITKVEPHKTEKGRSFHWHFQILESAGGDKKHKGVVFHYYTSLKPEALFNLRNLIFAVSDGRKNVTGKSINFDPTSLVGKKVGVVIEDDEYKGKTVSRAVDVLPPSQLEAEDEEDEGDDEDENEEDEDEDDDEDEDEEDEDEDELEDVDVEEDM